MVLSLVAKAGQRLLVFTLVCLAWHSLPSGPAIAQEKGLRVAIIGDSLANDLWFGFRETYAKTTPHKFIKYTKAATGLVRPDFYDWNRRAREISAAGADIGIVLIGGNDRQNFSIKGRVVRRFTEPWYAEYRRRVDRFNKLLKRGVKRVYWVALPDVRPRRMSRDYKKLNRVYAASAKANGATYIDIWSWSTANPKILRGDGLHFTTPGTMALARKLGAVIF